MEKQWFVTIDYMSIDSHHSLYFDNTTHEFMSTSTSENDEFIKYTIPAYINTLTVMSGLHLPTT